MVDLVVLALTTHRCETTRRFRQGAVLHGNMYLVPLISEVQCCCRVAVRLLYKGNDVNTSSRL